MNVISLPCVSLGGILDELNSLLDPRYQALDKSGHPLVINSDNGQPTKTPQPR